ncbi:trafficking protein particle complex subunit 10 [Aspergillus pseudoustus]|uniref:Trafficking protein particle complex subunit 10 n=1 Tax=Aspergillus pseudoustus TaxID=1810923 RepID=A0ABR4IT42_9EURO
MDSLPQAASSSVTVEYTDPSGLFSSVQPVIADKLPLRNLHWKSPTRPVRSIESLRIGFTPANHEIAERKPSSDAPGSAVTHRRHQIPGLRQTPYLKIYILRCDDNDTYKTTARKALREWIKSHGSSSTSSTSTPATSQEKHDAFEWLILHVVQDGDGTEKAAPTSKWGRTTTSVLEKVKADFNGSSKSAVDRVAQLRLPRQDTSQKSPELADQIEDFVEKIKNGILASFDLRVAQYEEDIKEKDSQRSLPGWNFCTFFILKEGLARGFENVGLFEDALLGYDELAIGLNTAIHEQLEGTGEQHGSAFLTYSKDLQEKAKAALDARVEPRKPTEDGEVAPIPDLDPTEFPINPVKKSYREMILSSNISIFDFRTYIFSRQLTLLLRASRAPSLLGDDTDASQKPAKRDKKPEDLLLLSEICERATEFISLAARTLRSDLESGLAEVQNAAKSEIVSNIVSSWAYAAASQILLQTFTPALTLPESSLHAADIGQQKPDVPRRTSSLIMPTNRQSRAVKPEMISPDALSSVHAQPGFDGPKLTPRTGSEQLASERGGLLLMARKFLEEIAGRCGWEETWTDLGLLFDDRSSNSGNMDEVSLVDENSRPAEKPQPGNSLSGVDLPALKAGLGSRKAFRSYYEELTDRMYRHHIAANRTNSTHTALADMALLRYRQSDYGAAASYFHQIAPFYGNKCWTVLEGVMLEMYARCLKELNRNEEYVRLVVRLLAKYAAHTQSQLSTRQKSLDASSIFTEEELVSEYVEELFRASNVLQKDIPASLTDFFADLLVKPGILHYKDKDGFQLQLYLRFLLGKRIDVDSVKIRLVSASSSGSSSEHWIEASAKATVKSSSTRILVDSSTTLQGKYFIDRIDMRAGNLVFSMTGGNQLALPVGFRESIAEEEEDTRPYIYCYPHPKGLQAKVEPPHLVNLEAMRTLELELNNGWNDIRTGILRVRPATAGLRLRIAEAEVVEGDIEINANTESGNIEFNKLGPKSATRFRIPYTVEEHPATLSARAEVTYETEQGRFSYSSTHNIVSALPISVNVQDVFKQSVLFSRFTVSPATMIPLWISKCSIPSSDVYHVQSNVGDAVAMRVFPKQPASLLYKIQPREDSVASPGARRSLRLSVDFTCIDDECFDTVEKAFKASISASEFAQHTTLLTPHIVEAYRSQLTTSDMEVIALVREIEALPYAAVRWDVLLSALKEPMNGLRAWLKEWHDNHLILALPEQPSIRQRHIIIPVDIPEIQVVHTAELRLTNLPEQAPHAAVGQTITAELRLSHTRRWCSPDQRENAGGPLEFSYELHANPELWMVGGRRRGNFTASEGETTTFAVMLLPQKSGHLLLPGLEIRSFVPPPASTAQSPSTTTGGPAAVAAGPQRRPIACEVDYRNHGETVLVLPDLRGTTVSLSMSSGHGGAWLIDSERRVQV